MKTKEQLQEVVDEIRLVCKKHGVLLVGTCMNEGIYSEIAIGVATQENIGTWRVTNRVDAYEQFADEPVEYYVTGIGDVTE